MSGSDSPGSPKKYVKDCITENNFSCCTCPCCYKLPIVERLKEHQKDPTKCLCKCSRCRKTKSRRLIKRKQIDSPPIVFEFAPEMQNIDVRTRTVSRSDATNSTAEDSTRTVSRSGDSRDVAYVIDELAGTPGPADRFSSMLFNFGPVLAEQAEQESKKRRRDGDNSAVVVPKSLAGVRCTFDWEISNPDDTNIALEIPETTAKDFRKNFETTAPKDMQKISDDLWLMGDFSKSSRKILKTPCVVRYWNYKWFCTCKMQKAVFMYVDRHCWHIEWIVNYLVGQMNAAPVEDDVVISQNDVVEVVAGSPVVNKVNHTRRDESESDNSEKENENDEDEDGTDDDEEEELQPKKPSLYKQFLQICCTSDKSRSRSLRKKPEKVVVSKQTTSKKITSITPAKINLPQQKKMQVSVPANEEYEVEALLGKRLNTVKQRSEYLIKWKGWHANYNSWVIIDDLNCNDLIDQYEIARGTSAETVLSEVNGMVVRYHNTPFFVVAYGNNVENKYCIVGPNKEKTILVCKHTNHAKGSIHVSHCNTVYAAIGTNELESVQVTDILPNYNRNIHELGTKNSEKEPEDDSVKALSITPVNISLEKDIVARMADFSLSSFANRELKPDSDSIPAHCKCKKITKVGDTEVTTFGYYQLTPVLYSAKSVLYSEKGVVGVKVFMVLCENRSKECTIHYQGNIDGIFNYNGNILITYYLLFDFLFSLITAKGSTFSGYASKLNLLYRYCSTALDGIPNRFLGKKVWIRCWMAFQKILNIKKIEQACELCGVYPRVLCFDGVNLGFPKKFVDWSAVDMIPNPSNPSKTPENTTPWKDRLVVKSVEARKLLLKFVSNLLEGQEEFESLLELLRKEDSKVHGLLEALYHTELLFSGSKNKIYHYTFYGVWGKLLGLFAKGETMNFFIQPCVVPVVNEFITTNELSVDIVRVLAQRCPLLCKLFVALPNKKLPEYAKPLMIQIVKICTDSYSWLYVEANTGQNIQLADNNSGVDSNSALGFPKSICPETILEEPPSVISGASYPFWPKLRNSNMYVGWDKIPKSIGTLQTAEHNVQNQWNDDTGENTRDQQCTKVENRKYRTKDLVAGLMVTCCPHTVKYGTAVMYAPEGRKDVMKVLYERLPQVVLDNLTVIYDFACQAAEYCINREPKMFCLTKFIIDRFHSNNHKCGSFWKLASYPGFTDLASTASESLNAFIQRFHSQCAYMRQETFILFLEVVTAIRNWLINQRTKEHLI